MKLSRDAGQLRTGEQYDVVVIGSGYGAGVMAARLPRTLKIVMLERGREFQAKEFPTSSWSVWRETQVRKGDARLGSELGLFDVKIDPEVTTLVGCGLGGTSLINGNVSIKPSARVFEQPEWPAEITLPILEPYYMRARAMLRPSMTPRIFPKAQLLKDSAAKLEKPFSLADITVNFAKDKPQPGCKECGNCVTGCPHGAKNTLCETYLPVAAERGVEIVTRARVTWIEKRGDHYLVHFERVGNRADPEGHVVAKAVVVSAGTLGSTEILLRSKDRGLAVSKTLGKRFSCNGDTMALGYNFPREVDAVGFAGKRRGRPEPGPSITSVVDLRRDTGPLWESMVIEEGSFPSGISGILRYAFELIAAEEWSPSLHVKWRTWLNAAWRELLDLVGVDLDDGALNHSEFYFAVGHDDSAGEMTLADDRLRLRWANNGKLPVYFEADRWLDEITHASGGRFVRNPLWKPDGDSNMLTAHPLGGCPMGRDSDHGVVNARGQVFDGRGGVHERLFVVDGSIIPTSLGVNPLWTISALAERIAEAAGVQLTS